MCVLGGGGRQRERGAPFACFPNHNHTQTPVKNMPTYVQRGQGLLGGAPLHPHPISKFCLGCVRGFVVAKELQGGGEEGSKMGPLPLRKPSVPCPHDTHPPTQQQLQHGDTLCCLWPHRTVPPPPFPSLLFIHAAAGRRRPIITPPRPNPLTHPPTTHPPPTLHRQEKKKDPWCSSSPRPRTGRRPSGPCGALLLACSSSVRASLLMW